MRCKFKKTLQTFCHSIFFKRENAVNSGWQKLSRARGFSLVELIVVMGIFTIISSVVMFNYGRFSSNLVVTNLAYESALAVRQAQVYGISVKQTSTGAKNFDSSYGVWFNKGSLQNFYLFSDASTGDKNIRANDGTEDEESFSMNGSNVISNFCVTDGYGLQTCSKGGTLESLSIIFKRPDSNAKIYGFGTNISSSPFNQAEIMFTSGRGDKIARMTVTSTGQISVDSCNNIVGDTKKCPE